MNLTYVMTSPRETYGSYAAVYAGGDTIYPWAFLQVFYDFLEPSRTHIQVMFNRRAAIWAADGSYIAPKFGHIAVRDNKLDEMLQDLADLCYPAPAAAAAA